MKEDGPSSSTTEANIQTFLRVRPSKLISGYFKIDDINDQALHFYLPDSAANKQTGDYVNNTKTHYRCDCALYSIRFDTYKHMNF